MEPLFKPKMKKIRNGKCIFSPQIYDREGIKVRWRNIK